ncbi:phage tail sheath subtilisin-like domain-containing protein [Candidatus Vondammii sp. HM_W22]|uniref:phage tail sheath subtilisin-like domain-containing protein n=1 Tax=Candidatus Vondammii sp. HM_W22 TaxID=2687299 RepID=UPI001F13DC5F|nr:phage tail sheath subtilisin-like domain-containing protein [Candidatus Vondammii sp. HM_W22]
MSISMNQIPTNVRVPLVYIEFDNSRAVQGTPAISHQLLVFGQRLAVGSVAADVPTRITSDAQAEDGSMLAEMLLALRQANRYTETWAIALDDDGAAAAATGNIDTSGTATRSGTLNACIGGKRVRVGISSGDTGEAVATALATAINADTTLPVTAQINSEATQVDLTARNKGEAANDIDLRVNYYQGERTPSSITVVITDMSGGTANPDIADGIAAMGDEWWNSLVMPYTDTANLDTLQMKLADRWEPLRMIDGIAYSAHKGTHGTTGTFGGGRNDHLVSCLGTGASPTPPWIWAAVYAGVAAFSITNDPARPLQTLVLDGILPPVVEDRWTMEERNLLLYDGISTYSVTRDGKVQIERAITTYQTNRYGVADPSYLDVTTPATLGYIRFATRARITQKFPRHKLADDGTRFGPGQAIVTPSIIRAELLALFRELEEKGLVENFDQYQADLIVERNADDRNRVDVMSPPDLVNQLRIFAEQIQFIV